MVCVCVRACALSCAPITPPPPPSLPSLAVTINFGKGAADPVRAVMFYREDRRTGAIAATEMSRAQVSNFLPLTFEEQILRVYARRRGVEHVAHAAFKLWCNDEGFQEATFFSPSRGPRGGGGGGGGGEPRADDAHDAAAPNDSQHAADILASQVML